MLLYKGKGVPCIEAWTVGHKCFCAILKQCFHDMKVGQLVLGVVGMEIELENVSLDQSDKQMQHVLYRIIQL